MAVWLPMSWPARGRWKDAADVLDAAREQGVPVNQSALKVDAAGRDRIEMGELDRLVAVLRARPRARQSA